MDYRSIQSAVKSQIGGVSPAKQAYWYKINGKKVSKDEYNAYDNKPGGDEPGKQTNDPDASGNKAKIASDRAKLPKKATVLTEGQTKVKDQGTKVALKPPFKAKKGQDIGGVGRSPLHFNWRDALDKTQTALTVGGMTPGWGIVADGLNTAVSLGRAGYEKYKGNEAESKKHLAEGGVNALAMIPGFGQSVATAKLGKEALKMGTKKLAKETTKRAIKKAVVVPSKKAAGNVVADQHKKKEQKNITMLNKQQQKTVDKKQSSPKNVKSKSVGSDLA